MDKTARFLYVNYPTNIFVSSSSVVFLQRDEVFAELILGQPLFTGKDGVDQLVGASKTLLSAGEICCVSQVQIVKVLGTPTSQQLRGEFSVEKLSGVGRLEFSDIAGPGAHLTKAP